MTAACVRGTPRHRVARCRQKALHFRRYLRHALPSTLIKYHSRLRDSGDKPTLRKEDIFAVDAQDFSPGRCRLRRAARLGLMQAGHSFSFAARRGRHAAYRPVPDDTMRSAGRHAEHDIFRDARARF